MNRAPDKFLASLAARAKKWGPSATLPAASYRALTLRPAAALPHFLTARSVSEHRGHSARPSSTPGAAVQRAFGTWPLTKHLKTTP